MIKSIIFGIISFIVAIGILLLFIWDTSLNNELIATKEELAITVQNFELESKKTNQLGAELHQTTKKLAAADTTIADLKAVEYELVYMGEFKITYYCDERYDHICGGNGVTASGQPTEIEWTAAADWSVLPSGSVIYIDGVGFREITDVGGSVKGNHIDVLVPKHDIALDFGIEYEEVWLLVKKDS